MMFETAAQAQVFLTMMYAGLLVGLGYDVLRAVRRATAANAWWTGCLDLLFWIGAALVVSAALALGSQEGFRFYALVGCACGVVLYLLGISLLLREMLGMLARLTRWLGQSKLANWLRRQIKAIGKKAKDAAPPQ